MWKFSRESVLSDVVRRSFDVGSSYHLERSVDSLCEHENKLPKYGVVVVFVVVVLVFRLCACVLGVLGVCVRVIFVIWLILVAQLRCGRDWRWKGGRCLLVCTSVSVRVCVCVCWRLLRERKDGGRKCGGCDAALCRVVPFCIVLMRKMRKMSTEMKDAIEKKIFMSRVMNMLLEIFGIIIMFFTLDVKSFMIPTHAKQLQ